MKHDKYEHISRKASRGKILIVVLSLVLLVSAGMGVTMAYFFDISDPVINTFQSGSVAAEIVEKVSNNTKTSIKVKNTGESPVYVRIRLISYWKAGETIAPMDSESVTFTLGSNWKQIGDYYYYTQPLAGGATTLELLGSSITMTTKNGYSQVIEVLAETVQASPEQAMLETWGVSVAEIVGGKSE